jgi:hypothetical protein
MLLLAAVAYNLKKLLKFTAKKVNADVKAMQKSLQNQLYNITVLIARRTMYWSF